MRSLYNDLETENRQLLINRYTIYNSSLSHWKDNYQLFNRCTPKNIYFELNHLEYVQLQLLINTNATNYEAILAKILLIHHHY